MPQFLAFMLLILTSLMSGCGMLAPYHAPVQQGVAPSQTAVNQLKKGMTPIQIEYLFGTANLKDPYHPNVWYYIYTYQQQGHEMTEKKLGLYFQNGQLAKAWGDYKIPASLKTSQN